MSGQKGRSGGARQGAGRPKKEKTISEKIKSNYLKAAQELAEEYGEPIEKAALRLVFKEGIQDSVKIAALKEYNQALVVKERDKQPITKDNEPETYGGPVILSEEEFKAYRILKPRMHELHKAVVILPEQKPDPALEIVQNLKKTKDKN